MEKFSEYPKVSALCLSFWNGIREEESVSFNGVSDIAAAFMSSSR